MATIDNSSLVEVEERRPHPAVIIRSMTPEEPIYNAEVCVDVPISQSPVIVTHFLIWWRLRYLLPTLSLVKKSVGTLTSVAVKCITSATTASFS